jgi:hypothetical protein
MHNYKAMMAEAYPTLLGLMMRLVDSQAGKNIQPSEVWRNDAQTLALKLFKHLVSMHNLAEGATIQHPDGTSLMHIDHGSIIVLARAALETYLVWHYLYGQPANSNGRYRHLTWKLGGLMDRQGLHTLTQEGLDVQAKELIQVESLREEIRTFEEFQALSQRQQNKLLAGDWKIVLGTADLAVAAGFHGTYFKNVYSFLCGYSHASYISALQIAQAKTLEDQATMTRTIMGIGVVTMAHFSCSYPKQFPTAQAVLDADVQVKTIADRWALMAEDMDTTYGTGL